MPVALQRIAAEPLDAFSNSSYLLVRPWFFFRRVYRVYGPDRALVAFVEHPWFRLRTELVMYADEAQLRPILVLKDRRVVAYRREHDLFDAGTGGRLGTIRDRGWQSPFRSAWDILDAGERPAGQMLQEGAWFFSGLPFVRARYRIDLGGREVARIVRVLRLFRHEYELRILPVADPIEPRFAIACALIALIADQRRKDL